MQPLDGSAAPTKIALGDIDWSAEEPLFSCKVEGVQNPVRCQHVERTTLGFTLGIEGAVAHVNVYSPREYELSKHMVEKPPMDTSRFILSPMPGKLVSVLVKEGDVIEEGQEVCVVEAMKMQNILRSPKHATIKKIRNKAGDSLKVDQIIIEFE